MTIEVTDRREWAQHPVTKEFILKLREYRQEILEKIGFGEIAEDKIQRCIGRAIAAQVFVDAIENLLKEPKETFQEIKEEIDYVE
jgi:hypothetical protein